MKSLKNPKKRIFPSQKLSDFLKPRFTDTQLGTNHEVRCHMLAPTKGCRDKYDTGLMPSFKSIGAVAQ